MKNFLYLWILLSALTNAGKAQTDTAMYRQLATQVQRKFAPDKRDIYMNLTMRGDSVKLESSDAAVLQAFEKLRPTTASVHYSAVLLPSPALNGRVYGVANVSVANNRSMPQHGAELMTQMLLGTPVQVLKRQGAFYLVRTPDQYLAWTDGGAVTLMNAPAFNHWKQTAKVVFTSDYGHAYSQADERSARVSDIVNGNMLELLGVENDFYKVAFPDQRIAYIRKADARPYADWVSRPNPDAKAVLSTAYTLMGVPYLWGGTSVKGVDCSGLTRTAYFLNGIMIPRDASQQALAGAVVDVLEKDTISIEKCLKNLQPGDLLFFSAAKRRGINGGKVSHTAIYIGKGEFIQSSAGMVKVSSLISTAANYDGGQTVTLVGARRIITAIGQPKITRIDQHPWYN